MCVFSGFCTAKTHPLTCSCCCSRAIAHLSSPILLGSRIRQHLLSALFLRQGLATLEMPYRAARLRTGRGRCALPAVGEGGCLTGPTIEACTVLNLSSSERFQARLYRSRSFSHENGHLMRTRLHEFFKHAFLLFTNLTFFRECVFNSRSLR